MTAKDDTRDLRRRVQARFGKRSQMVGVPEHVVLFEVPVDGVHRLEADPDRGLGAVEQRARRRIDAVAVGLWSRTQHLIHGFELKASRADLRAELSNPDKSEPARRLCDRWWLVLADKELLHDDDPLPDGWGVLYRSGRGLRLHREPAPIETARDPRFVAALVQTALRASGTVARGLGVADGWSRGYRRGKEIGYAQGERAGATQYWQGYLDGQNHVRGKEAS